ncbi:MAG TPA: xanthomonadin biosynthesis protein [Rhodanobacteraceae bacterium]|nr:xanthomonadin biosynthesis protein [Rhodanobacteraceae bacterium]
MSAPAVPRSSAATRVPWLPLVLLACAVLALAGGLSHRHGLSVAAAALLLLAWLPSVWRRRSIAALGLWLALAALLLAPALTGHPELALMALPVVFLAAIGWLFARTLKRGAEPLVTRFVRVIEGEARVNLPGVRGYTRGVTLFWAWLLAAMALLSLLIALLAVPGGWLATFGVTVPLALPGSLLVWYPEAGCWILLLAAFVGEYAFRRWRMRHIPHPPARRFVAQIVQRWPALMRGEDGAP